MKTMNDLSHDIQPNIKIERWKEHLTEIEKHLYFQKLKTWKRPIPENRVARIRDCCWILRYGHFKDGSKAVFNSNRCMNWKLCKRCSIIRMYEHRQRILSYICQNWNLQLRPWHFVVLPIKHDCTQSSQEVFEDLKEYLKKLTQRIRNWRKWITKGRVFDNIDGWIYTIEVTKSRNGWNWHLNILFYSTDDLQPEIVKNIGQNWLKLTETSYIHHYRKVNVENFSKSVLELVKYCVKFHWLTPQQIIEVVKHTDKKRFIWYLWELYGFKYFKPKIQEKPEVYTDLLYNRKLKKWKKPPSETAFMKCGSYFNNSTG